MAADAKQLKERLVATARELLARGLTEATAGNLSVRLPDGQHPGEPFAEGAPRVRPRPVPRREAKAFRRSASARGGR